MIRFPEPPLPFPFCFHQQECETCRARLGVVADMENALVPYLQRKAREKRSARLIDVLDAIRGERQYQDAKWGEHRAHEIEAYLTYIRTYISDAERLLTFSAEPPREVLHILRKVAALGVACMEVHGLATRDEEIKEKQAE